MKRNLLLFSSLCWILNGCAHLTPIAVSTVSYGPQYEETIGIVRGTATNTYFFGIQNQTEGMRMAVERAKLEARADNLINIYVDQRVTYYPFFFLPILTDVETIVTGTAVRYKDRSLTKLKDLTIQEKPDVPPTPVRPPAAPYEKPL